jgi:hypothetical protein
MPRGLKVPVGVAPHGGAALVDGDTNDAKIIKIALGSDESENAFQQDISLDVGMVFSLNDPTLRARILRRVYKIFDEFRVQKRFKLKKETMKWSENEANQELTLEFKYVNLESDEEKLFRRSFTSSD